MLDEKFGSLEDGDTMVEAKRIRVLAFAKFQGILLALVGFVSGIFYFLGGAIYDLFKTGSVNSGTVLAFLALIGMPIVFAAGGVILGLLEAVLYNIFAHRFGRVDIDFVQ